MLKIVEYSKDTYTLQSVVNDAVMVYDEDNIYGIHILDKSILVIVDGVNS
jgi:hypothetical protein